MPAAFREFRHPVPVFRRTSVYLIALALSLLVIALLGQVILALTYGALAILFCLSGSLTALLAIPLLLQTVLHPEIALAEDGILLRPMLWRAEQVPYAALVKLTRHPLLEDAAAYSNFDRLLWGKHRSPRQGAAVILAASAKVNPLYRLVGRFAGERTAAFAISSTTHRDYARLYEALAALIGVSAPDDCSDSSQ